MSTTTKSERDAVEERLNDMLAKRGSSARVVATSQNGGTSLALTDEEHLASGTLIRSLTFGTKREVVNYMRAMQEALWLLEPPYREQ